EVAEPILRHCTALTSLELDAIIRDFGWNHAVVIAARRDAPNAKESSSPPTARPAAPSTRGAPGGAIARASDEIGIAELFFSADSQARRTLLLTLGDAENEAPQKVQPTATIHALEEAALGRDRARFVQLIEGALSLSREQAERVVGDASGEPLL